MAEKSRHGLTDAEANAVSCLSSCRLSGKILVLIQVFIIGLFRYYFTRVCYKVAVDVARSL